jgi:opacity protein-like surface antigen
MKLSRLLLAGAALATLSVSVAQAADLLIDQPDQIFDSPLFNFEGFYVGGTAGGAKFPTTAGLVGTVGVVVGANFQLGDAILAGAEVQGDALWDNTGFVGYNALLLGKLGVYLSDEVVVYGTGGGGLVDSTSSYALGAGIEMALADQVSGRIEGMATGSWGAAPDGGKVAVGLIWHMN